MEDVHEIVSKFLTAGGSGMEQSEDAKECRENLGKHFDNQDVTVFSLKTKAKRANLFLVYKFPGPDHNRFI
jgi:hypothetical protein